MSYIQGSNLVWVFALLSVILKIIAFIVVKNTHQSTYCNPLNIMFDFLVMAVGLSAGAKLETLGAGWIVAFMVMLALFLVFVAVIFFGVFFSKWFHLLLIVLATLYFIIAWCMEIALHKSSSPSSISGARTLAFVLTHLVILGLIIGIVMVLKERCAYETPERLSHQRFYSSNLVPIPDTARTYGVTTDRSNEIIDTGKRSFRQKRPYMAEVRRSVPDNSDSRPRLPERSPKNSE